MKIVLLGILLTTATASFGDTSLPVEQVTIRHSVMSLGLDSSNTWEMSDRRGDRGDPTPMTEEVAVVLGSMKDGDVLKCGAKIFKKQSDWAIFALECH